MGEMFEDVGYISLQRLLFLCFDDMAGVVCLNYSWTYERWNFEDQRRVLQCLEFLIDHQYLNL